MGLLDDLQNEARQIKVREAQQKVELAAQDEFYKAQLRPVMLRAYEYYAELIENLNVVAPDIQANYPLNPLIDGGIPLRQANYKIKLDSTETPRQIDIFCQCMLAAPYKFYLPGQKILFCGDSIKTTNRNPVPSNGANTWDEATAKRSFQDQIALNPALICGGHCLIKF